MEQAKRVSLDCSLQPRRGPSVDVTCAWSDLHADPLPLTTGPIWAAVNLDYPHHSFSHIGLYFGENARSLSSANPQNTSDYWR